MLKAILGHWIRFFQPMGKIHSDRDIRFTGKQDMCCRELGATVRTSKQRTLRGHEQ